MSKLGIIKEFLDFLNVNKKYWLLPIIIVLALVSLLIIFSQGAASVPFIYVLF